MKYIGLIDDTCRELPFYLAMEEYVAMRLNLKDAFFMWQVNPTVIFGRNQLIEKEVNLAYCKAHGISTYRRKSGGGCVYADWGNIMFSYITDDYNVSVAYGKYLDKVVAVLRSLNVPAESTGRNDITVEGRKISGNAFYHINGKSVVHGTMLFDTDMENMINAITPATVKLTSKGVDSVRNRITTINKYLDITQADFKNCIKERLCDSEVVLDEEVINEIKTIEESYLADSFIYGKNPHCNIEKEEHIEGVGNFKVMIEINHGIIKDINLMGDFFLNGDLDSCLLAPLKGIRYAEDSVCRALEGINVENTILNLNKEQFIKLIII